MMKLQQLVLLWVVLSCVMFEADAQKKKRRTPGTKVKRKYKGQYINRTCEPDENVEPECDRTNGEFGIWVCRTQFDFLDNPLVAPKCILPERSIESDVCGCCDGDCPEICDACPCDYQTVMGTARAGVEVVENGEVRCVSPKASRRLTYRKDGVTCNTNCVA